jgi:PKD repeat protein
MMRRAALVCIALILLVASVQAGWLTGYDYRQKVHINGSTSGDLTNYQMNFSVYNTTGTSSGSGIYLGTKASDDTKFDDLRITTSDGTTLCDIWNETERSNGWDIWMEVPSIPVSGTDVYVYYGNSGASAVWNGMGTFPLLYDNFDGTSLNTSKWSKTGPGTVSISNSIISITTPGGETKIYSATIPLNTSFVSKTNNTQQITWFGYIGTDFQNAASFIREGATLNRTRTRLSGGTTANYYSELYLYNRYIINRNSSQVDFYYNNTFLITHLTNIPSGSIPIMFYINIGGSQLDVDYVFVRSYNYPEPVPSTWTSEEAAPANASFAGTPTSGNTPLTVSFTDTSTGGGSSLTVSTWNWSFGDGSPNSTSQNPTHTYTTSGSYTVTLTVTNSGGSSDTEQKVSYVTAGTPTAPTAQFSGTPTSGTAPLEVSFTDLSTGGPTSWAWTFGDGNTSIVQHPTHTYATGGTYTIVLNATNAYGSDLETKTGYITVSNATTPTPTPTPPSNTTYFNATIIDSGDTPYLPWEIWLMLLIVTMVFFFGSIMIQRCNDICAMLAAVLIPTVAYLSGYIDFHGVEVTQVAGEILIAPYSNIAHPPYVAYLFGVGFFGVAIVNVFRVWFTNRRRENLEDQDRGGAINPYNRI